MHLYEYETLIVVGSPVLPRVGLPNMRPPWISMCHWRRSDPGWSTTAVLPKGFAGSASSPEGSCMVMSSRAGCPVSGTLAVAERPSREAAATSGYCRGPTKCQAFGVEQHTAGADPGALECVVLGPRHAPQRVVSTGSASHQVMHVMRMYAGALTTLLNANDWSHLASGSTRTGECAGG